MMTLNSVEAAIFDMDGTLTDNMPLHVDSFARFGGRYNLAMPTAEVGAGLAGKRNREIMPVLFGRDLTVEEIERYEAEKEAIYHELIAGGLAPVPGLARLLDLLHSRGIPAAVATSAPAGNVAPTLRAIGAEGRFDAVVLGADVPRSKPAPDIFLEAARRLGRAPERCLVFEDAYAGVAAAKAAGMRCVALATTHTVEELRANTEADLIVRDYEALLDLWGLGKGKVREGCPLSNSPPTV
jgi:HAD superfamily hydrolase (TIGR01509 family)